MYKVYSWLLGMWQQRMGFSSEKSTFDDRASAEAAVKEYADKHKFVYELFQVVEEGQPVPTERPNLG